MARRATQMARRATGSRCSILWIQPGKTVRRGQLCGTLRTLTASANAVIRSCTSPETTQNAWARIGPPPGQPGPEKNKPMKIKEKNTFWGRLVDEGLFTIKINSLTRDSACCVRCAILQFFLDRIFISAFRNIEADMPRRRWRMPFNRLGQTKLSDEWSPWWHVQHHRLMSQEYRPDLNRPIT